MSVDVHVNMFLKDFDVEGERVNITKQSDECIVMKLGLKATIFLDSIETTRKILEKWVSDFNNLVTVKVDQGEK